MRNIEPVSSLDRYILRQCLVPFAVAITVVTMIVWMTQSLQRADVIVDYSQGLQVFARLSLLIIPSLLTVIIPFSLFAAALYAMQRMHSDNEIAVMFAAGVSRMRIALPILAVAAFSAGVTLWVNLDLMPASYRVLKQEIANIRADLASSVLKSGEFVTLADGFTIYVDESRAGGQLVGILINDYRNGEYPETYMAQRGLLRETDAGPVLQLVNGNIQRVARYTGKVDVIRFEQTAVNIGDFAKRGGDFQLELTERYLSELFNPDLDRAWDREHAGMLIAEGHNRLSSPLYVFAYVLIALYALIGGAYNRRGYGARIAIACATAGGLRVTGIVMQGFAANSGAFWLLYATPLAAIGVAGILLLRSRHRAAQPQAGAA